ncbi:probable Histone-lysine N-methyltransferase ATXR5 isoform X2 [Aristolochia californica]|uniref:probable Histone-lysine N-methyltransferase ATXR5 isoform X2 n=1 Tax=Aristolochia californica TaxID=171875 RepID=UPI0035DB51F3
MPPSNLTAQKRTEAPRCLCAPSSPGKKFKSLAEIMKTAKKCELADEDLVDVCCVECGSGDGEEEMLLCDKCDKGFHIYCLRPIVVRIPAGSWFCPRCSGREEVRAFPLRQTKIMEFFRIQKCMHGAGGKCRASPVDVRRRRRRPVSFVTSKKSRKLLPFNPTEAPVRRLEQMGSLATALRALKMEFSNELTYMAGMAPRSANQAMLENGGMQVLSKEDAETLELCQTMWKQGEWPPLMVVFDSLEGFTVEADGHIKDLTLIAEYTGDVDYLVNRENDDCDSMMTLLLSTDSSKSLVICPDKRGNIARFINGINNHTPEGRKKRNLKCVRYNVEGECRALLVATRDIGKAFNLTV